MQVDISNNPSLTDYAYVDVVRRDGKLYDKLNHTYEWDQPIYCDIVWLFSWNDVPPVIQDYITARAASIVSSRIVGDTSQYQMLQQKEAMCRANALEYECNQGDYSYFGKPREGSAYQSFQPFKALQRW